jgi:hypothetical protein
MAKLANTRASTSTSQRRSKAKFAKTGAGEPKAAKLPPATPSLPAAAGQDAAQPAISKDRDRKPKSGSKQARVIAMLQSAKGATIAAMMQATEWQQHSVRGFLAGVVRKKLQLKLESGLQDGHRVYRIVDDAPAKRHSSRDKRRRAG